MTRALSIRVRGIVQGVGFRPYVFRLARARALCGWVLNGEDGVQIHVEGPGPALDGFVADLSTDPPPAAHIAALEVAAADTLTLSDFTIRESRRTGAPTTRISPDLPVCGACLRELFDPANPRFGYPYINCTECGPRYSIVRALPYDRAHTTMAAWPMCEGCSSEYHDVADRRFHAQPVACARCGPRMDLRGRGGEVRSRGADAFVDAARLLREGRLVAVKSIGGYHLACDARGAAAVEALRDRKFRKDKPFAIMARDLAAARAAIECTVDVERLLTSTARPIVLAPARLPLAGVAPDSNELGVMLPSAPVHHLLFAHGAPDLLVMTSGNRSSEPIACTEEDAFTRLDGIADAWLAGERPIARRLDDSVVRLTRFGPVILRRSRGYAPAPVAELRAPRPILAVGADLKNTITLVVDGQAYVGQHVGDLEHFQAYEAFRETVADLTSMYEVRVEDLLVVCDRHPQYASTAFAESLPAAVHRPVQHHRAHVASVLAERGELDRRVVGVAFDGTGFGDDGTIWGGEIFAGSVREGFTRVAHLHAARLPGGDAAARHPVQSAAGFLAETSPGVDLRAAPFSFPDRYRHARTLLARGVRVFETTSAGRLFDAVAAVLGFTRGATFEGQAAMWLEAAAHAAIAGVAVADMPYERGVIDWRPALADLVARRSAGCGASALARGFHVSLGRAVARACRDLLARHGAEAVVLSGGVFQNALLVDEVCDALDGVTVWTNQLVPPNDGGISLGQAALAAAGSG